MLPYTAPQDDILFSLLSIAGGQVLLDQELDRPTIEALLSEGAKLAEGDLALQMRQGDTAPPQFRNRAVTCGPEMHAAHRAVCDQGWVALPFPAHVGGLSLPWAVSSTMMELATSAHVAFALSICMTDIVSESSQTCLAISGTSRVFKTSPHLTIFMITSKSVGPLLRLLG